jgi:predicted porin
MLGATWNIGAFSVFGSWQSQDADGQTVNVGGTPINFDPDFSIYAIGATYNLSRRTNFYSAYASRDADGTLAGNQFDAKQFMLGIRHLF